MLQRATQQKTITFRYGSETKKITLKSQRNLNERMSPWLQSIFGIKNPIVGFKILSNNHYYDAQMFYQNKHKFYGQTVSIIQTNDQLQISFVSDNLNSSANIRPPPQQFFIDDYHPQPQPSYKMVNDTRDMQRRLSDQNQLNILFIIHKNYQKQIIKSINFVALQQNNCKVNFYVKIIGNAGGAVTSHYRIYVGRKLVVTLNLTRQYKETIIMTIARYEKYLKSTKQTKQTDQKCENTNKVLLDQQNEVPSFTTYQLQQKLSQQLCLEYLKKMCNEKILTQHETSKLLEKCYQNYTQFTKIFCQNLIDNDYDNFKNHLLTKIQNNLELLLSNVDQMDLQVSTEEQQKQYLKNYNNLEIVQVQNYFEILDQLINLLSTDDIENVKCELLEENCNVENAFAKYLSKDKSKEELADFLKESVSNKNAKPVPRSPSPPMINTEHQFLSESPRYNNNGSKNSEEQKIEPIQKQETQQLKLGGSRGSGTKDNAKNQIKQIPPSFGTSKEENNFSPIKYMSDIESNYKQAWKRLQNKSELFQPQQYGLLYFYLQSKDDSISNHIQELQLNEQSSITKLKTFLSNRILQIMQQNFTPKELDCLASNRSLTNIDCIYQNFKYQSDILKFISALTYEISVLTNQFPLSPSSFSSPYLSPPPPPQQKLTKKASDSKLFIKKKKLMRKYSDQNHSQQSPKQSLFSLTKTSSPSRNRPILQNFWNEQFQQMINHFNLTEQPRYQYLREAFKEGNPSVYSWINSFIQGKLEKIDLKGFKQTFKTKCQQNKYLVTLVPIFSEILNSFVEEGKLTHKIRKWCVVELLQLNSSVFGAFQQYIRFKNADDLIHTVTVAFELQNSQVKQQNNYFKRISKVLQQMSVHDEIGLSIFNYYPKQIEAICELFYCNGDIDDLLNSLDTMHQIQKEKRSIKVATLNFSGINSNPFQYFDGSQELSKISSYMEEILSTERQLFSSQLSSFDKNYTNNKMSVRFGWGMCEKQTLFGRDQYCKRWFQFYNNEKPSQTKEIEITQDRIESCMIFDYYCYLSVVKYVYDLNWTSQEYTEGIYKHMNKQYLIEGIEKLESDKLKNYLQAKHNRPGSNINLKYQLVMGHLMKNDVDVLFLQEAGNIDWGEELLHDFGWVKGGNSVILYRKSKFGNMKTALLEQYISQLQFNNDTAVFFGDRGYLLLSIHLSSKRQLSSQQGKQIFNILKQINDSHPLIKIIIGIDANHFIADCQTNFLNFFPKSKEQLTTVKKRTHIQTQFKKSGEMVNACKDFILTNLQFQSYSIKNMNGSQASHNNLLPSDMHPFDHFIVSAEF